MLAPRPRAGTKYGRYELVRPIGSGGMGTVYLAIDRALNRKVALKLLSQHAEPSRVETARARFFREARAAAAVKHPHVVDVFDFGVEDEVPYLVMELVEGETLAQRLKRAGRLDPAEAIDLLLPIFSAVAELHSAGIVHRDLKPANILLERGDDPRPRLTDFGVSRLDDGAPPLTQSGAMLGTTEYMSPEQTRGGASVTERSDQYALGVVLYECVTGQRPFRGATTYEVMHAIVTTDAPAPSTVASEVPRELDAVIARAMARDPEDRFACVEELAAALLRFAPPRAAARWRPEFSVTIDDAPSAGDQRRTFTRGASPPPARAKRRWPTAIVAAVVAAAGIVVAWRAARVTPPVASTSPSIATAAPEAPAPVAPLARPAPTSEPAPTPAATASPASTSVAIATPSRPARAKARVAAAPSSSAAPARSAAPVPAPAPTTVIGENGAPILDVP